MYKKASRFQRGPSPDSRPLYGGLRLGGPYIDTDRLPRLTCKEWSALSLNNRWRTRNEGTLVPVTKEQWCPRCNKHLYRRNEPDRPLLYRFGKDEALYCSAVCRDLVAIANKGRA
jgi:hypothetical protein